MRTYVVFFRKGLVKDGCGVRVIDAIDENLAKSAVLDSEACSGGRNRKPEVLKVVPLIDLVTKALK
jgi:hypothetical protein